MTTEQCKKVYFTEDVMRVDFSKIDWDISDHRLYNNEFLKHLDLTEPVGL